MKRTKTKKRVEKVDLGGLEMDEDTVIEAELVPGVDKMVRLCRPMMKLGY